MKKWILPQALLQHLYDSYQLNHVSTFGEAGIIKDATIKCELVDKSSGVQKFMLVSNANYGNLVTRAASNSASLCKLVSPDVAAKIVTADFFGEYKNFSYAIYPKFYPLTSNRLISRLDNYLALPKLISWHKALINDTKTICQQELLTEFSTLLGCLQDSFISNNNISEEIGTSITRLSNDKTLTLYSCASHDDLWTGNVLKSESLFGEIRVIDWAGLDTQGTPFYDLIRALISFNAPHFYTKAIFDDYLIFWGCSHEDAKLYLHISLAKLFSRLENYPVDRFQNMALQCTAFLGSLRACEVAPSVETIF